jgi:hypothetical protein
VGGGKSSADARHTGREQGSLRAPHRAASLHGGEPLRVRARPRARERES